MYCYFATKRYKAYHLDLEQFLMSNDLAYELKVEDGSTYIFCLHNNTSSTKQNDSEQLNKLFESKNKNIIFDKDKPIVSINDEYQ